MRKLFFVALIFGSFQLLSVGAQAQNWTESKLQKLYTGYLSDMDLNNWVDDDGDVQFEYNDHTYFIDVSESDPEFFRVVLFNIWPIESISENVQVLMAVDAVNRQQKVCKAYTINDNVWIATELFVADPADFKPVFQRSLDVIESSVEVFVENM